MNRAVIPWGIMLVIGMLFVFLGFTNRFGDALAAFLAPAALAPSSSVHLTAPGISSPQSPPSGVK